MMRKHLLLLLLDKCSIHKFQKELIVSYAISIYLQYYLHASKIESNSIEAKNSNKVNRFNRFSLLLLLYINIKKNLKDTKLLKSPLKMSFFSAMQKKYKS